MKQIMIDMMNAMMPYMKLPMWVAITFIGLGMIFLILRWALSTYKTPVGHSNFMGPVIAGRLGAHTGLTIASWVLIAIGIFYLACHAMGLFLGMSPKINFGDPTNYEFNLVPFWQLGAGALVAGIVFRLLNRLRA